MGRAPPNDRLEQPAGNPAPAARGRWRTLGICGLLLLAIALVFGQTLGFEFVNWDDNDGVYENPRITGGLRISAVVGMFTQRHVESWCPLTSVSHMLTWCVFGYWAGGHHLTNVALHAASALLLFFALRRMTGAAWPSALVAAVFAVHPLHVESVAWVTERKDTLSGLFFMLALTSYLCYVSRRSLAWYLGMLGFFALGLVAKPMVITLPFVLLLLDYWPLGRLGGVRGQRRRGRAGGSRDQRLSNLSPLSSPVGPSLAPVRRWFVLGEKLPLLVLVGLSCCLTIWGQRSALGPNTFIGWEWRIQNAAISYAAYLGQFVYPAGLCVLYPRRSVYLPPSQVFAGVAVLLFVTSAALVLRRKAPYLLVGWLWYLGMLVPVIGLVQFGAQSEADRFTYLPQIGLYILLAWAAAGICWRLVERREKSGTRGDQRSAASAPLRDSLSPLPAPLSLVVFCLGAALLLAVMAGSAWRQTVFWQSSESLWIRAIECTPPNYVAYNELGSAPGAATAV